MRKFILITSKDELELGFHYDPLSLDLESQIFAKILKDAVQNLIRTKEFDEYLSVNKSIQVYMKSADGRIHCVPQYYDLESY